MVNVHILSDTMEGMKLQYNQMTITLSHALLSYTH